MRIDRMFKFMSVEEILEYERFIKRMMQHTAHDYPDDLKKLAEIRVELLRRSKSN
jgi:hypothetical protein